jgi:hypothetical protein
MTRFGCTVLAREESGFERCQHFERWQHRDFSVWQQRQVSDNYSLRRLRETVDQVKEFVYKDLQDIQKDYKIKFQSQGRASETEKKIANLELKCIAIEKAIDKERQTIGFCFCKNKLKASSSREVPRGGVYGFRAIFCFCKNK